MDQVADIEPLAALAKPSRMGIFRLLVRTWPTGLKAGEISRTLGIFASTLVGHLAILRRAGLPAATLRQREILDGAELSAIGDLVAVIVSDCCDGRQEESSGLDGRLRRTT